MVRSINVKSNSENEPDKIDVTNHWECIYWCSKLLCSREQLIIAVNEVGPKVSKIKEYIVIIKRLDIKPIT